jgi:hypothetical protein
MIGLLLHAPVVAALAEEPDRIADTEAREANLESNSPREGFVFSGALGFGVLIGGDIGVGRGAAVGVRAGHVATRTLAMTFELVGTTAFHKEAGTGPTLTDSNFGLFVGVQRFTPGSTWLRVAGGLDVFAADVHTDGKGGTSHGGLGGIAGAGYDFARWGYFALGVELFTMASVTGDGLKLQLGFCTNLSYY